MGKKERKFNRYEETLFHAKAKMEECNCTAVMAEHPTPAIARTWRQGMKRALARVQQEWRGFENWSIRIEDYDIIVVDSTSGPKYVRLEDDGCDKHKV